MTIVQRTIARDISVSGVGLHSGRRITLTLHPAAENSGIVFRRVDCSPAVVLAARPENVNDTRLATTLNVGKVFISTIEHLMSAFSGLGIDNVVVDVNDHEIPIMDGSASDFVDLVREAGIVKQQASRSFVRVKRAVRVEDGDKWAQLEPHEGFVVDFSIAFHHPVLDATPQRDVFDMARDDYALKIARSRTFGFVSDFDKLRAMGLIQGGSLDNAIAVDEKGIVNPEGLRNEAEFVRHKMLDAMGDLYVLGHPLLARYTASKSGHGLNNRLLRALVSDPDAWEMATAEEALLPSLA
ncbi:MAG: UDP-3-O-acyl-N-acetylglucosamine deacetylase [Duodenibacillus sp.]|nr:UDP-3-O-acyl-N-acetylglucosamine deacetylase [Duodenibacillus sp.]